MQHSKEYPISRKISNHSVQAGKNVLSIDEAKFSDIAKKVSQRDAHTNWKYLLGCILLVKINCGITLKSSIQFL